MQRSLPGCSGILPIVFLVATLLFTALAYWPGLAGDLLLDDHENLKGLETAADNINSWQDALYPVNSGPLGRPLSMLSFLGNMFFNGPDVWIFKYTNLMIHLLCGVLIFWLSARLFLIVYPPESPRVWILAWAVTAFWLLAPLLVSTTLYIIQRMTQLSALFSLCGLIAYVEGRRRSDLSPLIGWILILSSVLLWMPLAVLSKENGILIAPLLLTIEVFFFGFHGSKKTRHALHIFFLICVVLPLLAVMAILIIHPSYFLSGYSGRPFTLAQRVFTEARVLFFYLWNLIFPNGPGMGLFHDDFVVSRDVFTPWTTPLALAGWMLVIVACLLSLKHRWRPLFFGICFFLVAHSLESSILPLELIFEHRNYLPAFGVYFSLALGIDYLRERLHSPKIFLVGMALMPMVYGFATYQRADTWSSLDKILLSAEMVHPNSPRVHIELASLYSTAKNLEAALHHLDRVTSVRKSAASGVSLHRIIVYCNTGDPIPQKVYADIPNQMAAGDAGIYAINALRGLNRSLYSGTCPQLDIPRLLSRLEQWITNSPKDNYEGRLWDIHYESAHLLQYSGRTLEAMKHLKRANEIAPDRPEALLLMLRYEFDQNNLLEARRILTKVRETFNRPSQEQAKIIARYAPIITLIDNTQ